MEEIEISGTPSVEPDPPPMEEEVPSDPAPEQPPAVEEIPGELPAESEAPEESGDSGSGSIQDIIDAIGELGDTLAGAGDSGEPAETQPPATEQGGAEEAPPVWFVEYEASSGTDLTPVVELLEVTNESLVQVNNNLLQLQANVNFVFLAVCVLIGAVIGCGVVRVLHDLWRS